VTVAEIVIDARLVGLVVAGLALWRRLPFVVVIVRHRRPRRSRGS
jgi:hypothetical protein